MNLSLPEINIYKLLKCHINIQKYIQTLNPLTKLVALNKNKIQERKEITTSGVYDIPSGSISFTYAIAMQQKKF